MYLEFTIYLLENDFKVVINMVNSVSSMSNNNFIVNDANFPLGVISGGSCYLTSHSDNKEINTLVKYSLFL